MKDKNINFSIDKLCVLGKFKNLENFDSLIKYCYNNLRFKPRYITNQFFGNSFLIEDLGFFQVDRVNNSFRFEFNPNHVKTLEDKDIVNTLLSFFTDFHFSRLDIALDLYNYGIYDYNIIDLSPRKKAFYYDRVGRLETCYFGAMGSDKFIRIYNKAKEQKIDNMDWWRVELQLRDDNIDIYLEDRQDFLKDVYFFKYIELDNFSTIEKATLEYLLHDYSRLNELTKNQKTKYKKIIKSLKGESLDFINPIIQHNCSKVVDYLKYLCPSLYKTYSKSYVFNPELEFKTRVGEKFFSYQ